MSPEVFPRRAIHFDFHTMPGCEKLGKDWNAAHFVRTLQDAKVEFINFFAKCNLGFCYFPTQTGTVYPGLDFDLLGGVQFPKKGNCQIRQPIKKKTGMALVFFYFSFMVC